MNVQRLPHPGALAAVAVLAIWGTLAACRTVGTGPQTQAPRVCADCHRAIARQWRDSPHAQAWLGENFIAESKQYTKKECLPCHAPLPLLEQEPDRLPRLRAERRRDGVDCYACHQVGCAQAGPCNAPAPHATVSDGGRLGTAGFCGRCHEQEYKQHRQLYLKSVAEGTAKTCIACHMPVAIARLTQGHLLSRFHPRRIVGDHSFCAWTEELLRGVLEASPLELLRTDGGAVEVAFTLTNRGAGHRIPTGKHGYRELRVRVRLLDAAGAILGMAEDSLLGDSEEGLEPGKPRAFAMLVEAAGNALPTRVQLLVERVNEDASFRVVLLEAAQVLD